MTLFGPRSRLPTHHRRPIRRRRHPLTLDRTSHMDPLPSGHHPSLPPCALTDAGADCLSAFLAAHAVSARAGIPFVTPAGLRWLGLPAPDGAGSDPAPPAPDRALPRWDRGRRLLSLAGIRLKAFHRWAPCQMAVLTAFEDGGGWAAGYVDAPLPPDDRETEAEAAARLCETVKNLNRGLRGIRFHLDPGGSRVWWEVRVAAARAQANG